MDVTGPMGRIKAEELIAILQQVPPRAEIELRGDFNPMTDQQIRVRQSYYDENTYVIESA